MTVTTSDHILPPPVRDTGPLETMARTADLYTGSHCGNCEAALPFDGEHLAQAIITALTGAGFAIVPVEPPAGVYQAMLPSIMTGSAPDIYRAMIAAVPHLDTKEGGMRMPEHWVTRYVHIMWAPPPTARQEWKWAYREQRIAAKNRKADA